MYYTTGHSVNGFLSRNSLNEPTFCSFLRTGQFSTFCLECRVPTSSHGLLASVGLQYTMISIIA